MSIARALKVDGFVKRTDFLLSSIGTPTDRRNSGCFHVTPTTRNGVHGAAGTGLNSALRSDMPPRVCVLALALLCTAGGSLVLAQKSGRNSHLTVSVTVPT